MIESVRLWRYLVPFRDTVDTSQRQFSQRTGFIICATTAAGTTGWGEAAPLPGFSRESSDSVEAELTSTLPLLGRFELDGNSTPLQIVSRLNEIIDDVSPSVQFCLETMIADLYSQIAGLPLRNAWFDSEATVDEIEVNYLVTGDNTSITSQLDTLRNEGVSVFKLKVGRDPENEIDLVRRIRQTIGADCKLRLDANRAFTLAEASQFLKAVADYDIEYIEEPLKEPRSEALQQLSAITSIPIALDEAIAEWRRDNSGPLAQFADGELTRSGCFQVAVLKPAVLGGLRESYELIEVLDSRGVKCVITSALESDIGIAAAAQLAGSLPGKVLACGLATSNRLESSLGKAPYPISRGKMRLPLQPGLGMEVDLEVPPSYLQEIKL